jgi:NADH-quinone oxidoreductase subunit M
MLKLGGYSFIRFAMPIAPDASLFLKPFMISLSLIAIVYIAFVALIQKDMKKLIAYSSISHMGFVTLGLFLMSPLAVEGAYIQMMSHGFISAAMFICVGILYDQTHSREIKNYGGVINKMPIFTAFAVFFAMANAGLPGTSGFVGEFMVILGAMKENFWIAFIAATTLILGAAYSLWLIKRVFYGDIGNAKVANLSDIKSKDFIVLGTLASLILFVGVYPKIISDITNSSVLQFIELISFSKAAIL